MRLILIRHGQTQSNVDHLLDTAYPGAPLTDEGHKQARALPAAIAHEDIDALFASTLTRAQETAAPLAEARGLVMTVIDGVQEIAAGVEEMSRNWEPYVTELASWSVDNLDSKLEGGESAREFITRFDAAIASIEEQGHERVAVVSHGAALRVWAVSRDPEFPTYHARALRNTEWIVMNGTTDGGWRIESWGSEFVAVSV